MHLNLALIIRAILSFCFLLAVFGKLKDGISTFADSLLRYRIVPQDLVRPLSLVVVILEGLAGLMLLTPMYTIGACITGLLGLSFAFTISASLVKGRFFPCSCFV